MIHPARLLARATALLILLLPGLAHAAQPGVNVSTLNDASIRQAVATGAKTVRLFVRWDQLESASPREYTAQGGNHLSDGFDAAIRQLNAGGAKPLFVVLGTPSWANGGAGTMAPPSDPQTYAEFFAEFVAHSRGVGAIAGFEVWNEPDEPGFWAGGDARDPATYAALLKATYAAAKPAAGPVPIAVGPLVGNDFAYLEGLYANGAQGSFDAVGVHTDTACLDRGPDNYYREDGRLARFTFLGYREVRATMLAHGDDKPIWMSELGWSSTGGRPNSCTRGTFAGQKPDGVTEAAQADDLAKAFACLANDPYVTEATWFNLQDSRDQRVDELNHYGLLRADGSRKPVYGAFAKAVASGGGAPGPCGDFSGPALKVLQPAAGQQFVDRLDLQAKADDAGTGLSRISFTVDGKKVATFAKGLTAAVGLTPYYGSSTLPMGPHTIEVTAFDASGNQTTVKVPVVKVASSALTANLIPRMTMSPTVGCRGRVCSLSGSLGRPAAGPTIGGRVAVEWERYNPKLRVAPARRWRRLSGGLAAANKPFTFKAALRHPGQWRVRLVYRGQAPYKKITSRYLRFSVR